MKFPWNNNISAVSQRYFLKIWVWTELSAAAVFITSLNSGKGQGESAARGQWVCAWVCVRERENISCTVKRGHWVGGRGAANYPCVPACVCLFVCMCVLESAVYGVTGAWVRVRQSTTADMAMKQTHCLGDASSSWKECDLSQQASNCPSFTTQQSLTPLLWE